MSYDPYTLVGDAAAYVNKAIDYTTDGLAKAAWYVDPRSNEDTSLSQSEYDFTYKVFPADLGMDYLGHYMVININVPVYPSSPTPRGSGLITSQFKVLPNEYSKVDVLRYGNINSGDATTGGGNTMARRTRRIAQSIALYMPGSQLVYTGTNAYEEISMTSMLGQLVSGAASKGGSLLAAYLLKTPAAATAGSSVGQAVGSVVDAAGKVITVGSQLAGMPINPCVEVLFSTTALREFTFDFLFVPRNEKESQIIEEIIRTLRFHSAPEVTRGGFTFIPPAEFDITFFHRGVENTHVPRINTSVMVQLEVDYSSGMDGLWTSFRNGQPVATRVRMTFKEVELVHKLRVLQGF
jgi:hypothetical protein